MADNRIIHIAMDYDYTPEDAQQIMGMILEAQQDPDGAGVIFTRNDVRITVIDLPEKIGSIVIGDVSYGPTAMEDLGDIDEEGFEEDECSMCDGSGCKNCLDLDEDDTDEQ